MLLWKDIEESQKVARYKRMLDKQRQLDSLDEDAKIIGIKPETWKHYKDSVVRETYTQDYLPGFLEEEARARESSIDVWDTTSHLARFFVRMDKCKDPKVIPLCRQQKKALMPYFTAGYRNKQR